MPLNSPRKTNTAAVFVLILVLANAIIPIQNVRHVAENNERVTRTYDSLAALRQVLISIQDAETGQRGYIITGKEEYLQPYKRATGRIDAQLKALRANLDTPILQHEQEILAKQVETRLTLLRRGIDTRRAKGFEATRTLVLSGRGKSQMDAIRATIASVEKTQKAVLNERDIESRRGARGALLACAFTSLLSLALLAMVYIVVRRDIGIRQRAEAALRASNERFSAIVNATSQIVWTTNANGQFVEEQPSWSAFTGQEYVEYIAGGGVKAIHPEDVKGFYPVWQKAVELTQPAEFEYRLRRHDGQYRVTVVRAVPVLDAQGNVREWIGTNTDITERREAEAELRSSEARKAAILETSLDCIVAIDAQSRITEWNPAAVKTFGFSREEAMRSTLPELIIPHSLREAHHKGLQHYLATGVGPVIGQRIEVPALCADGHEILVELSITRVEDEGAPCFSAYLRDITARKESEENLAAHAKLASLGAEVGFALNQSDELDDILQHCTQALVHHLDAAFARIWTLNEIENILELKASAGIRTDLHGPHSRIMMGQFKIGQIAQERLPHLTNSVIGDSSISEQDLAIREKLVSFAGYPLMVEGRMLGVMAMFARHTLPSNTLLSLGTVADAVALGIKRKRSEEELEKARQAAEEASRTKSLFLANMSHELRTPLNAILGYSEMLQEEATDLEMGEFVSDLARIHLAGKHLLSLINDILDLSKIEAGKMELYIENFSVEEMMSNVVSTIAPQIEKNGNTLQIEYSNLGEMSSDQTKVQQCLLNLLSNAAKFTLNGQVTLEAHRERMVSLEDTQQSEREWLVFSVRDSGIGMSSEQVLKLFQAFTQADASTTRKFGGTGLGLALTRRFSQMMGGDVTVHSELGQGSTFTIKIPADGATTGLQTPADFSPDAANVLQNALIEYSNSAKTTEKTVSPSPYCVLIIDDDATQRDLMERFLNREGFETQTASSGEEGLRLARQLKPVAITLDVMMRGMDGWSVLSALKADETLHDIPVVMLTMVDDKNRGYALGAADYATKPVDRRRLMQILQKYVCPTPPCPLLLIEDDDATRQMMRQMLERAGWHVSEAANGRAALESLEQNRPELILLDLMMPEMDGFSFAEQMRKRPEWRDIPIVVLTAKELDEAERFRLNGYVQKVLQKSGQTREEILQQVRELLRACVPQIAPDSEDSE